MPPPRLRNHAVVQFCFWSAVFTVSYGVAPLYTSNQNQYFLHGLARAGMGMLSEDWLANTADPTPVFTLLVWLTRRYGGEWLFYFYQAALMGVYLSSLLGIVASVYRWEKDCALRFFLGTALILAHSPLIDQVARMTLGIDQAYLLHRGVASQYLPGNILQPSLFGVFLLRSILLYIRKKPLWGTASAALAAVFHPTYLLAAAMVVVAGAVTGWRAGLSRRRALMPVLLALLMVSPVLVYSYTQFIASFASTLPAAQEILTGFRMPFHILSRKSEWGELFWARVILMGLGPLLARRSLLFPLISTVFGAGFLLSLLQVLTGSNALGLIFPWRVSVILLPLSLALVLGWFLSRLRETGGRGGGGNQRWKYGLCGLLLAALCLYGFGRTLQDYHQRRHAPAAGMMQYVRQHLRSGQQYLIPALRLGELEEFRLATGAPLWVDFKAIPYRGDEVLEWYRRLQLANAFYGTDSLDCTALEKMTGPRPVTHVVVRAGFSPPACPGLQPVYMDKNFAVFERTSGR